MTDSQRHEGTGWTIETLEIALKAATKRNNSLEVGKKKAVILTNP